MGGHPLAWAVARRVRQYPVDFGRGSTFVESVDDPSVEEPARRLLAYMRYTGLVELEFKRDPRHGRPKLLDINPRIWGWHTLAGRAGVDFPYLSWRLARGEHLPATRARPGVRWVRRADIRAALAEFAMAGCRPLPISVLFGPRSSSQCSPSMIRCRRCSTSLGVFWMSRRSHCGGKRFKISKKDLQTRHL